MVGQPPHQARDPEAVKRVGPQDDWEGVGDLVCQALVRLGSSPALAEGDGLSLFYVPFSDLGSESGADLRWEVTLLRDRQVLDFNDSRPALVLPALLDRQRCGPIRVRSRRSRRAPGQLAGGRSWVPSCRRPPTSATSCAPRTPRST